MGNDLYFIVNRGCDDSTFGLARICEEDFPKFKTMIENLNKNSYYGCMPTIAVYGIDTDQLKEITYDPTIEPYEDGYVSKNDIFYFESKTYTFADEWFDYFDLNRVI